MILGIKIPVSKKNLEPKETSIVRAYIDAIKKGKGEAKKNLKFQFFMGGPAQNEDPISFYEGEYYMFSNFASFAVEYNGKVWMTVEHAYQAAKFEDKEVVELIHKSLSAHDSKKIAHDNEDKINPAWDSIKISVMEEILREKISMHPYVKEKLLETGSREIIEDSDKDSFWGRGPDFKGRSELGKVWMRLRSELQSM